MNLRNNYAVGIQIRSMQYIYAEGKIPSRFRLFQPSWYENYQAIIKMRELYK